jgi:hypothetical protein
MPGLKSRIKLLGRCFGVDLLFYYIRAVRAEECAGIQEEFERTFAIRKEPEGMLLARAPHAEPGYLLLIWLSTERDLRALYREFKPIGPYALPDEAELLSGHTGTFEKLFAYEK